MMAQANKATDARAGFTLIETLAAFAIVSAIIVSTGVLMHDGVFFFDRGTRAVDQGEQLSLAIECLNRDFGAARFVLQRSAKGVRAAFTGLPAEENGQAKIVFITAGGRASGPQGEEVVSMTVESRDEFTQLVRRRSAWRGPRMHLEDARLKDPVVLLKGKFDISFGFSELAPDGKLVWHDRWTGENGLPHSVRMILHDDTAGPDLQIAAEFPIHADAPAACGSGKADCLSLAARPGSEQAAKAISGQASQ